MNPLGRVTWFASPAFGLAPKLSQIDNHK
jgi:hypothetical protein